MCIRSAQTVLELRRSMDDVCGKEGIQPARSWIAMEHVFLAALTLAADVSFNPNAPNAEARKAKVLAAYQTLERSREESTALMERIQRNMQALMSTLQKQQSQMPGSHPKESTGMGNESYIAPGETVSNGQSSRELDNLFMVDGDERSVNMKGPLSANLSSAGYGAQESSFLNDGGAEEQNWDQLWSEFLGVTPEFDDAQWSSLLDDMDFSFQQDIN